MFSLIIDFTIPLWGIIILTLSVAGIGIRMYFGLRANTKELASLKLSQNEQMSKLETAHKEDIKGIKNEMYHQEKAINSFKKDIEEKLDKHKHATDQKLSGINDISIETRTLVKLLVDDRIKK